MSRDQHRPIVPNYGQYAAAIAGAVGGPSERFSDVCQSFEALDRVSQLEQLADYMETNPTVRTHYQWVCHELDQWRARLSQSRDRDVQLTLPHDPAH
jgi:hypothetical protein